MTVLIVDGLPPSRAARADEWTAALRAGAVAAGEDVRCVRLHALVLPRRGTLAMAAGTDLDSWRESVSEAPARVLVAPTLTGMVLASVRHALTVLGRSRQREGWTLAAVVPLDDYIDKASERDLDALLRQSALPTLHEPPTRLSLNDAPTSARALRRLSALAARLASGGAA